MANNRSGSVQVTLASNATVYEIFTLVNAIDSKIGQRCSGLSIQYDPSMTGTLIIGDSSLSSTRYGARLLPGESVSYGPLPFNGLSTRARYLQATVNTALVNIDIIMA